MFLIENNVIHNPQIGIFRITRDVDEQFGRLANRPAVDKSDTGQGDGGFVDSVGHSRKEPPGIAPYLHWSDDGGAGVVCAKPTVRVAYNPHTGTQGWVVKLVSLRCRRIKPC